MAISSDPGMAAPAMPQVKSEQAQILAAENARADAPMARAKTNQQPVGQSTN